jgi:hypothetical protein
MQKELIMINQDRGFAPAEWDWMGWPADLGRTAAGVIEKTRRAWASRGIESASVEKSDAACARFAHPLFTLILDAKSSGVRRARRVRVRSRRRAFRQFAV